MLLLPAGEAAILIELPASGDVLPLAAGLQQFRLPAVLDLVPAERTILVGFDPAVISAEQVCQWVRSTKPAEKAETGSGTVELEVRYDGVDLPEVADQLGITVADVVQAHTEVAWTVAFGGFAPGFAYLRPPDGRLAVRRRDSPRPRVPAGSVALAAGYAGVYPRASPGGWQLIGRTGAVLWDASRWDDSRRSPALLQPGMLVRFKAIS
jgi:KipI family sensor histidine kinase inhibitor